MIEKSGALASGESEREKGSVQTEGVQCHVPTAREGEVETTSHENEGNGFPRRRMVGGEKHGGFALMTAKFTNSKVATQSVACSQQNSRRISRHNTDCGIQGQSE